MLVFFVIIIALFPLAIGPRQAVLTELGVPIIWIAALAILAGFGRLFAQMFRDGWLDQVSLSQLGLGWYALAKGGVSLTAGLPLLVMTPIMAHSWTFQWLLLPSPDHRITGWQPCPDLAGDNRRGAGRGARHAGALLAAAGLTAGSTDFDFRHAWPQTMGAALSARICCLARCLPYCWR